jgi:hypothetical protein
MCDTTDGFPRGKSCVGIPIRITAVVSQRGWFGQLPLKKGGVFYSLETIHGESFHNFDPRLASLRNRAEGILNALEAIQGRNRKRGIFPQKKLTTIFNICLNLHPIHIMPWTHPL